MMDREWFLGAEEARQLREDAQRWRELGREDRGRCVPQPAATPENTEFVAARKHVASLAREAGLNVISISPRSERGWDGETFELECHRRGWKTARLTGSGWSLDG